MDKSELEALLARIDVWLLIFGVIVVIGVAGESFFGIRHWWNSRKLQAILNAENVAQRAEIAAAQNTAGADNERAGKLEKEAADLTAQNVKLEAAIAPRRLSERQEKALSTLTQFTGRMVGIKSYSSDTEGLILATQIADALAKSKVQILDNRLTIIPMGSVSFGVSVEGPDKTLVDDLKRILSLDGNLTETSSFTSLCCLSWNWRERSSVKITERTHAKKTKALHRGRESSHPQAALARQSAGV